MQRTDLQICMISLGDAVVNVYINHEKKFAFVEMRTVEEASNAMALDGIIFEVHATLCKLSSVIGIGYNIFSYCFFIGCLSQSKASHRL